MKKSKVASMKSELPRTSPEAMAPKKTEEDCERDGHCDLDHLIRAEEIKGDSKRMDYVHKAREKRTGQMRSIGDLKMASQALAAAEKDELKAKAAQPRHKTRYPKREA